MLVCAFVALLCLAAGDYASDGLQISRAPTISLPPSSGSGAGWWPFSKNNEYNKELLEAAQNGDLAKAKAALDKGADVDSLDHVRYHDVIQPEVLFPPLPLGDCFPRGKVLKFLCVLSTGKKLRAPVGCIQWPH